MFPQPDFDLIVDDSAWSESLMPDPRSCEPSDHE